MTGREKRLITYGLPAILLALTFLLRFSSLALPLDRDEGAYAYIGWIWMSGKGIPYLSAFDHKPPLPYLLYGMAGLLGGNTFFSIRLLSLVYISSLILVLYFFLSFLTRRSIAFLITVLFVFYTASIRLEGTNFNTEFQAMQPFSVFLFLLWKLQGAKKPDFRLALITGIAGGISIFFRLHLFLTVIPLLVWVFVFGKYRKRLLYIFSGLLVPYLVISVYFTLNGALADYLYDVFLFNGFYVKAGLLPTSISDYFLWIITVPSALIPFFVLSLLSYIITFKKRTKLWWFSVIIFLTTFISVKLGGGREHVHYYIPMILSCCFAFMVLIERIKRLAMLWALGFALIAWVFLPELPYFWSGPISLQVRQFGNHAAWFHDAIPVAKWIEKTVSQDDSLLVWANEPEIYYYSRHQAPHRFINLYPLGYSPDALEEWLLYLVKSPPDWIITYTQDTYTSETLLPFLESNRKYKLFKEIGSYYILQRQ